jgi:hypothetical protein
MKTKHATVEGILELLDDRLANGNPPGLPTEDEYLAKLRPAVAEYIEAKGIFSEASRAELKPAMFAAVPRLREARAALLAICPMYPL